MRGNRVRVRKDLSVCFSVDTTITSHDIIVGFDEAGIDVDDITSIQRRASNNLWVVTFGHKAVKDAALNEQSITFAGCTVLFGNCEHKVSIVKIYELPSELPDSVVIGRLSYYGRVISFRHDRVADTIFNGVRTARMSIQRPIPAQTFIAGEFCRFLYPNQPKTCRKCGEDDHLAATCRSQRCFNCEQPGHRAEQCDQPALCRVCLSDGHETASCPFIFYSANVIGAKPAGQSSDRPAAKSYSGAARAGEIAAAAREAEHEDESVKHEERKKKERKEKERKEKEQRERKERERDERDYEDRRERDKRKSDKHHDRGHKESDDHRKGRDDRERDRDRYRSSRDLSRDRSSHRHYEHSDSEESEGWTRVSHQKHKSKSY